MKKYILIFLLVIPLSLAFDCSLVDDTNYCQSIVNSNLVETEKDSILSFLLYSDNEIPNHQLLEDYNRDVEITSPPIGTAVQQSQYIKNAWLSFLTISPSVYENTTLYVPSNVEVLSEYNYEIETPSNYYAGRYPQNQHGYCKIKYYQSSSNADLNYYYNGNRVANSKSAQFSLYTDGTVRAELIISATTKIKYYEWKRYRFFGRNFYRCKYHHTDYSTDSVTLSEEKQVKYYTTQPRADLTVTNQYRGTTKGNFSAQDYSQFTLSFEDSSYTSTKRYYDVVFEKKPFYIAFFKVHNTSYVRTDNILIEDSTFYVKNTNDCELIAFNHFNTFRSNCDLRLNQEDVPDLESEELEIDFGPLLHLLLLVLIFYILYRMMKSQMKKFVLPLLLVLVLIPTVLATSSAPPPPSCSLSNLGACLTENFFQYLLAIILSGPLVPLLMLIERLLTSATAFSLFYNVWNIVRYILSFFYVFFFLYSGFSLLIGGGDPIKRMHAKEMLQNTALMIIMINASFYFYKLILEINSVLNASIIRMIDASFFLLTADNIVNLGLQFMLNGVYGLVLLMTALMLTIRYMVVSFGVVLFPIGIFLYYIPPLKGYGKLILNMLGVFIFITFIDLLIILGCSMIINIPLFANMKIIVMITCFMMVNYTLLLAIMYALKKSANVDLKDDVSRAVKYVAALL